MKVSGRSPELNVGAELLGPLRGAWGMPKAYMRGPTQREERQQGADFFGRGYNFFGERAAQKNLQFVTDAEGRKTAVIFPIEEYEEMMGDLEMGRAARESKGQPRRPFEDVVKEWCSAGEIDV